MISPAQSREEGTNKTTTSGYSTHFHSHTMAPKKSGKGRKAGTRGQPATTRRAGWSPTSKKYARALAKWAVAYLKHKGTTEGARAAANKAVPAAGSNAAKAIISRFSRPSPDDVSLLATASSGRPRTYTPEVCERAVELLGEADAQGRHVTLLDLTFMLLEEGTLQGRVNRDQFSSRLRKYAAKKGYSLNTQSRRTIFLITENDHTLRRRFCSRWLVLYDENEIALRNTVFIDDTTAEESPHPKGQ